MKLGIMFESGAEFQKYVPVDFIAEMWANVTSFDKLTITQKARLQKHGFSEEKVNSYIPLIQKAKKWAWETGSPQKYVFTSEELAEWKELEHICQIIR